MDLEFDQPTLSELIEACGSIEMKIQPGLTVVREFGKLVCERAEGKTPEEAVIKLCLALNKK